VTDFGALLRARIGAPSESGPTWLRILRRWDPANRRIAPHSQSNRANQRKDRWQESTWRTHLRRKHPLLET